VLYYGHGAKAAPFKPLGKETNMPEKSDFESAYDFCALHATDEEMKALIVAWALNHTKKEEFTTDAVMRVSALAVKESIQADIDNYGQEVEQPDFDGE